MPLPDYRGQFTQATPDDPSKRGPLVRQRRVFSPGKGGTPDTYSEAAYRAVKTARRAPSAEATLAARTPVSTNSSPRR